MPFEPEFRFNNTDLPVTSNFLGGERSILLSYRDLYEIELVTITFGFELIG